MQTNQHQTGFSLIEVLIALCLVAIILLEIAKVHLRSVRINQQAMFINQASEQLRAMANTIRAANGDYVSFLTKWNQDNKEFLPNGYGEVKRNGEQYNIYLFWRSGKNSFWRCDITQKDKQSCVELTL
ncbi:MAG: prepilin-type N-terminal cleavage/methylation domain-containing protein [Gammaproteobacteria bacterium]|jgi:prepilin-type N-terminal cleavage/methylation domain-containing protein